MSNRKISTNIDNNSMTILMDSQLVATFTINEDSELKVLVNHTLAQNLRYEDQEVFFNAVSFGFSEASDKLGVNPVKQAFDMVFNEAAKNAYLPHFSFDEPTQLATAIKQYDEEMGESFLDTINATLKFNCLSVSVQENLERQFEWVFCNDGQFYNALAYTCVHGGEALCKLQKNHEPFELGFINCDYRYFDKAVMDNLSTVSYFAEKHVDSMSKAIQFTTIEDLVEALL
ncbi:hypothetical protein [Vibrio owensii]|uniref:hypothetical protein n=1 Tax=Vibrio owensii TaxID=696485 RepID=UPI003CC55326